MFVTENGILLVEGLLFSLSRAEGDLGMYDRM